MVLKKPAFRYVYSYLKELNMRLHLVTVYSYLKERMNLYCSKKKKKKKKNQFFIIV